jgi:hypothetical protein
MQRRQFLKTAAGLFVPTLAFGQVYLPHRRKTFQVSAAYTANATAFDGSSDYMTKAGDMTGAANSKIILCSLWFKFVHQTASRQLLIVDKFAFRVNLQITSADKFEMLFQSSAGANVVGFNGTSALSTETWHHVITSFDSSSSSNRAIYIDGSSASGSWWAYTDSAIMLASVTGWSIASGYESWQAKLQGSLCELWFSGFETSWFDITNASNLAKFRTAGGKPENLGATGTCGGALTQPLIYLKNDYTSFGTNSGSGGNFTANSTPYSSDTPP